MLSQMSRPHRGGFCVFIDLLPVGCMVFWMKVNFDFNALLSWAESGGLPFCWEPSGDGQLFQLRIGGHMLLHSARRRHGDGELVLAQLTNLILTKGMRKPALSMDTGGHFALRIPSPMKDDQRLGQSLLWGTADQELTAAFAGWPYQRLPKTVHEPQPATLHV